jgi:hypothetical protein
VVTRIELRPTLANRCDGYFAITQRAWRRFVSPILLEDVIDPVQSDQAHDDQIDRYGEAHDPRRDQQKHSRGQRDNRQQELACIEVQLEFAWSNDPTRLAGAGQSFLTVGRYGLNNRGETSPRE